MDRVFNIGVCLASFLSIFFSFLFFLCFAHLLSPYDAGRKVASYRVPIVSRHLRSNYLQPTYLNGSYNPSSVTLKGPNHKENVVAYEPVLV